MKDSKSLILILLSAGLVTTWVYHLYDKMQYSKMKPQVVTADTAAVARNVRDSLQKVYNGTIDQLGDSLDYTRSNADSLQTQLTGKVATIRRLKAEINAILGKKGVSREDLATARGKIAELQQNVDELRNQNGSIEEEKQRLLGKMEQLNTDFNGLQQNMKRVTDENRAMAEKLNQASTFIASEIHCSPVTLKNGKEEETGLARKTSKLVISFALQNNIADYSTAEVYVIVTQPDGKVLKNDVWESGSMFTRSEGQREFTRMLRFEYAKGESKKLIFSINADEYQKGNYKMEIYHNGVVIGRASKMLQ